MYLQHYIDNAVDTNNLGEYNANFKRFQKHIKPGKEGLYLNLPTLLIEKGRWVLVRWDSIRISNHAAFLLRVSSLRALITKHLNTLKDIHLEQLKDLLMNVVKSPDISGSGRRNAHLLAVAPNASSSIICGGTSPSIEPYRANVYTHKTLQVRSKLKTNT